MLCVAIAALPLFCVEQYIERGELEQVLSNYRQLDLGIYAVYPHRQFLSTKVRAFVDFMVERFAE